MPGTDAEEVDGLSFAGFTQRLRAAGELQGARLQLTANEGLILQWGPPGAACLSILSGVHGDERSGPIAALRWLEETAPGALVPRGVSVWMAPLVNDEGWNSRRREWREVDLNRSFVEGRAPGFLRELMGSLRDASPLLFIDLHEDSDVLHPYVFRKQEDTHDLSQRLQRHLSAREVVWSEQDAWEGASEVYVRSLGHSLCTTIEAPPEWPLARRVEWQLQALRWCADHVLHYAPSGGGRVRGRHEGSE